MRLFKKALVWTLAVVLLVIAAALITKACDDQRKDDSSGPTEVVPVLEETTSTGTGPVELSGASEETTGGELPATGGVVKLGGR